MPGSGERELIRKLAAAYPRPASALLPALHLVRRSASGAVTRRDVRGIADILGLAPARAWGAATYYSMFRSRPPGKYHLQVDTNIAAMLSGSEAVLGAFERSLGISAGETTADGLFTLSEAEDLGAGGVAPAVLVNDTLIGGMSPARVGDLVSSLKRGGVPQGGPSTRCGTVCSTLLREPAEKGLAGRLPGGYRGLKTASRMKPDEIITWVEESNLRGRGGGGYPTGKKWRIAAKSGRPVILICNADEGEPGTFKDRHLLEEDPHLLLEGIAIAARALGSSTAFVYIRGEYRSPGRSLGKASREARAAGLLDGVNLVLHYGAGSYLCGEETALISSLQGERGEPRPKPPYPVEFGLYGFPTVVNNVETLAALPSIFIRGPRAFSETEPLLFSVCGNVKHPGLYEYPAGTPLRSLLAAAGGVSGGLKGVFIGGLTSPILRAERAEDLLLGYDDCLKAGTSLGSGAVIVLNENVSMARIAARAALFFSRESCGLCAPCREGTFTLSALLEGIRSGTGSKGDRERALRLCRGMAPAALCPGGVSFASSLEGMLTEFPREFSYGKTYL